MAAMNRHNLAGPIRTAFLGGSIDSAVGRAHASALSIDRKFELVGGLFSRHRNRSLASAEAYGIPIENCYQNIDGLIEGHKKFYDAVVVLTPTDSHCKDVLRLLGSNIPVICEKSLATSLQEVEAIADAINTSKGFLRVTYNYTGYPMIRELRARIRDNQLGQINQVLLEMPQESFIKKTPGLTPLTPQAWRLKDGRIPTVSLDLGTHLQAFIKFLTSEVPSSVVGTCQSHGNFDQVKDSVASIYQYRSGMFANIWYTKAALGHRNGMRLRIFGSKGSAEWYQMEPELLKIANQQGDVFSLDRSSASVIECNKERYNRFKAGHPAGYIEAFANHYTDIAVELEAYLNGRAHSSDFTFGVFDEIESMRIMESVHLSASTEKWVSISDS